MKKCKDCGTVLKENAKFCTSCGASLEDVKNSKNEQINSEGPKTNQMGNSVCLKEKIGKKKNLIFVGIVALVLITGITMFVSTMKKTIKLSDYYEVTYEGGNGFGKARVHMKYEELEAAICEIKDISVDGISYWSVVDAVEGYIEAEISPQENLKNGDKVEVTFNIPNEKFIKGVKIKADSIKVEVEGLETYKEITDKELFKDIEVTYKKYSPNLLASVENKSNDEFLKTVDYSIKNNGEIANGDTITIEASWNDSDADESKCVVVASGKKKIKVEGQEEYILNKEMITDDMLKQIKEKVEEDYTNAYSSYNKFKGIKEIYLADHSDSKFDKNTLLVLIELEPSEKDIEHGYDHVYFNGVYHDITARNGEVFLGKMRGTPLDIETDTEAFEHDLENAKANDKATYNLLEK